MVILDLLNWVLSFLEVEDFDRESKDSKEEDTECYKHSSWGANHPRAIAKTNFQVFFHTTLKPRSFNNCFNITKLGGNDTPKGPCNRADVVEPYPPVRDVLYIEK